MTATRPLDPPDPRPSDVLTVRCTEDVLALVPHLLGFAPHESLVMATFGSPHGAFHARLDLPLGVTARRQAIEVLRAAVERNRPRQVMVLAYTEDAEATFRLCRKLVPALQRAGTDVIDAVRVDARHWWDAMDRDARPTPYDVSTHPFTLQRIVEGSQVLPSRDAVAATLVGTDPALSDRLLVLGEGMGDLQPTQESAVWLLEWVTEQLARCTRQLDEGPDREGRPEPIDEADLARVLCLVREDQMRVVVWTLLTRATSPGMVELWRSAVRAAPPTMRSGAAALVALSAWLAGDGALAWCAIECGLQADPSSFDAATVAGLLQGAVAPDVWTPPDPADVPLLRLAEAS